MKRILLALGLLFAMAGIGVLGYAFYLVRSIDSPEFRKSVVTQAEALLGTDVEVKEMSLSLFSGVTLRGVAIANPKPFSGKLLDADAFVLRYRLLPLLAGRVEVERLALERPRIAVAMNARGQLSYEKLLASKPAAGQETSPRTAAPPLQLVLRKLAVSDASLAFQDHTGASLMKVEAAALDAGFTAGPAGARGSGHAAIATLGLADMLFLRQISSEIRITKQELTLAPVRGRLAEGTLTGKMALDLTRFSYSAELEVFKADVTRLLEEAKSPRVVSGSLAASAVFQGSGGLPTLSGSGRAEIADCRVRDARVLVLLSKVLQLPDLANPDFEQCQVEFQLARSRVRTPVVSMKGAQIQLTGKGTLNLETSGLDYDMTLALAQPLLAKVTVRELRSAFRDRGDGFSAVDFHVSGTTSAPQTDLASRVGRAAAVEAAKSGLGRLFRRK